MNQAQYRPGKAQEPRCDHDLICLHELISVITEGTLHATYQPCAQEHKLEWVVDTMMKLDQHEEAHVRAWAATSQSRGSRFAKRAEFHRNGTKGTKFSEIFETKTK